MHNAQPSTGPHGERGFSLVELMVAMAIGSIIATALLIVFINVLQTNREQYKAAQQIENGRFAIDLMVNDMRLAGYYGEFANVPPAPTSLPDPCVIPAEGNITLSTANSPFGFPVQGYAAANISTRPSLPTNCATLLDNATLRPGSDVVVIRRLDTRPLIDPPRTAVTATPNRGDVYAQGDSSNLNIQYAPNLTDLVMDTTMNAKGASTEFCRKDFSQAIAGTSSPTCTPTDPATSRPSVAAYVRKVHVNIYFVANCRDGTGSEGKCTTSDDTIPTLKRLELTAESGTRKMKIVPLVDGIEFLKVHYGLDTSSHLAGAGPADFDGSVDSLVAASGVTLANWQNVVMLDLRLLARNAEATNNWSDPKTYNLGVPLAPFIYPPSGDDLKYKRHAYTSQVYIQNIGGRREL